jgi:Flp pilus assembly protein TadG
MPLKSAARRGQALVMASLCLVLMFSMLAFAVDLGWMDFEKQRAQAAADAAALATVNAAMATAGTSPTCATATCQAETACASSITAPPTKNTDNGCLYAQKNGFTSTGNVTVTVQSDVTATPPTVTGITSSYWATVRVSRTVPALFSNWLGAMSTTVAARATAAIVPAVTVCIDIMNPTADMAFQASGNAQVLFSCGLAVNSNNAKEALYASGSAIVSAPSMQVVGQYAKTGSAQLCSSYVGGVCTALTPTKVSTGVTDPLVNVAAPSATGVTVQSATPLSIGNASTVTLNPGIYKGGISIGGNSNVTFSPGTYFIYGGGLSVTNGAVVNGTGVTFFLTKDPGNTYAYQPVNLGGGTTTNFSAPNSGAMAGMLFFQDRTMQGISATETVSNGANVTLQGSLYFPLTRVSWQGGSNSNAKYAMLVADTAVFANGATFNADFSPLVNGPPGKQVRLVE